MEYAVVCSVALVASLLTLLSGFGLGTLLLPAFALFFDAATAVAMTAVVHLANNLFKSGLLARMADWEIALKFGLPGALAAIGGAQILLMLEGDQVKRLIGALMIAFALFDLIPRLQSLSFSRRALPVGGLISGFFGGLSGHQGALRAAFLTKLGLSATAFVATNAVIAIMVDLARIPVYAASWRGGQANWQLVAAACVAAFVGAVIGARLMRKTTMGFIRYLVGALMIAIGLAMVAGWI